MAVYKDEKKNTWYVKFSYRDSMRKIRQTTKRGFKTKREAMKYEIKAKEKSEQRKEERINDLVEKYLLDKKLQLNKNIEIIMNKYVKPKIGHLKMENITALVMKEWQNELIKMKLKKNTIRTIQRNVSVFINYLMKYYGLEKNPLKIIGQVGKEERDAQIWTKEEFEKFIRRVINEKHRICYKILYYSGMRIGELLALRAEDFDFHLNKIKITKSRMGLNGEITRPKTENSKREIEMPKQIMREIEEYINWQEEKSRLFDTSERVLIMKLKKIASKLGIPKIRLHDLRHSHVSYLIKLGVPITTISRRLGHKTARVTLEVYAHMYEKSGQEAVAKMEADMTNM